MHRTLGPGRSPQPCKVQPYQLEKIMKLKQTTLATAIAATLALGMSGQAAADVYAGSSLNIDNLSVAFLNAGLTPANGVTINSFNFSTTNTALINGVGNIGGASCGGTPTSNSCAAFPVTPVLDGPVTNAPGSAITRTNNQVAGDGTLTWLTIGGGNWSNSDSVIYTSEITSLNANVSHTDQISESNITSAASASASSEILSTTGLTFNFTVAGPAVNFALSFDADPDMRAQILNDLGLTYSAQATMAVSVALTKDGTFSGLQWAPDGASAGGLGAGNCISSLDLTCTELADTENLNQTLGTSTNNTAADYSYGPNVAGLGNYGLFASGLTAGNWTLTLKGQTSTNLTRQPARVPEPGMLALIGIGLAGMGFVGRRRKAA